MVAMKRRERVEVEGKASTLIVDVITACLRNSFRSLFGLIRIASRAALGIKIDTTDTRTLRTYCVFAQLSITHAAMPSSAWSTSCLTLYDTHQT